MSAIIIPEYVINGILQSILEVLKFDIDSHSGNKKESYLYSILGRDEDNNELKMNRYNFFEQAADLFSKNDRLKVNYGFNLEIAQDLSLHIILPSENGKDASLGADEGYLTSEDGIVHRTQGFYSNYQIMITSSNSSEVLLVYHVLKSFLILLLPTIDLLGLRNPKIGGGEVMLNQEYVPAHIFSKVINLSFSYDVTIPTTIMPNIIERIKFKGNILNFEA
jgi:hypothetical protein